MAEGGKRNMEYKKFSVRKFSERAEVVGIQEKCSKLIKGRKFDCRLQLTNKWNRRPPLL